MYSSFNLTGRPEGSFTASVRGRLLIASATHRRRGLISASAHQEGIFKFKFRAGACKHTKRRATAARQAPRRGRRVLKMSACEIFRWTRFKGRVSTFGAPRQRERDVTGAWIEVGLRC